MMTSTDAAYMQLVMRRNEAQRKLKRTALRIQKSQGTAAEHEFMMDWNAFWKLDSEMRFKNAWANWHPEYKEAI